MIRTVAASAAQCAFNAGGCLVPIVRIEMLPGRSLAQKREMVRVITDAVCNIAHTDPKDTLVVFQEYSVEDWASDGKLYVDQDEDEDDD
jgi:4-oxalocrotonate tautomerase